MSERHYLIDIFSLVFQVFHAIPEMTGPSGQPTNAVFGITRDLLTILRKKQPTHLWGALDSSGTGKRNELYPAYKANRSEMPDDLRPQIPVVVQVLEGFGIPVLSHPGWEADDVIATLVKLLSGRDAEVSIVTSDKDARQLLSPRVRMYNVRKDTYLGIEELLADWGIAPHQVIDFQTLVGDSVDNVPGIPLVGPKKAGALLAQFGTLENILAQADKVSGAKLRENLKQFASQARISRKLVTLYDDLPLEVDWEGARTGRINAPRLLELFTQCGFHRFADEVRSLIGPGPIVLEPTDGSDAEPKPGPAQKQLDFGAPSRDWRIVDTPEGFAEFVSLLGGQRKFCLDLETTNIDAVRADIVGWAISWEAGSGWYLPVQGPAGQRTLDPQIVVDALRPILEHPDVEVVNQNIKYDMLVLRRAGIALRNVGLDPMVGDYLLDAGARRHGLDELAERYLGHKMIPIKELIGTGKTQLPMNAVDIPKVAEYAVEDAEIAWQLTELIERNLRSEGLWELYWDLERPLIGVLADMEFSGIKVDAELLREQSRGAAVRLEKIQEEIYELAGRKLNIESPLQLRAVLFDELKLPVIKKTKTGASTDQEVLESLAAMHPLPAKIIEHRRLAKLKNTYLDALPEMINPETGKIHASFNQVVAATGRLSSSDPNLQNIPIRTEEGRRIRAAFIPSDADGLLLCADYSQIELRMLAHYCRDPALVKAFAEGVDVHTAVAAEIFVVEAGAVDREMRTIAKAVNFGVIYGQSAFGLAAHLGISQDSAAKFIDDYFRRYAGVEAFLRQTLEECRRSGYATTILGRRRAIEGIRPLTSYRQLNLPERTAVNAVIQGSAADLIKRAMINVHVRLRKENHPARMLLQIHDELVFDVPRSDSKSLAELVREEMEHALDLAVPIQVDIAAGPNWLDVEPLD